MPTGKKKLLVPKCTSPDMVAAKHLYVLRDFIDKPEKCLFHEQACLKMCRTNPPKYKCPRCATPTCSLPCSKRHKLWSQCSGVRDPAAYLKRSELATPAAFDKDFNFISGIERYVERAERDAENRGIELVREDGDSNQRCKKRTEPVKKGEVALLRGVENAGVKVVRAPKGMSRGKQNMSYWHKKHKCLSWTVEWILVDDHQSQKALNKCLESTAVAVAFSRTSLSKQHGEEMITPSPAKKRKLDSYNGPPLPPSTANDTRSSIPNSQDEPSDSQTPHLHILSPIPQDPTPDPNPDPKESANLETNRAISPANRTDIANTDNTADDHDPNLVSNHPPALPQQKQNHYFYLHRPQSRSRVPVLIPLATESVTLSDALRSRVVLEFPTFYVLPWAPKELPEDRFMLEEVYLRGNDEGGEEELGEGRGREGRE
ncbi:uncharacterized protein PADG_03368 [Paracoccidioides brasiliensis Pb18]|uniref:HIT-type domain-containing protein n=1 Tax=Paracoccidioides brasiliensis (strain Pb18) TaxID=502780 RepID=C1G863_PARBD|nr:uncharacterized protein PADG_03368 [Paracoccidioides brasiliensis Pb18]EEH47270.2 hypothetical protein PADG_03368 [Paracoccidioides brasiliensis Pb18]